MAEFWSKQDYHTFEVTLKKFARFIHGPFVVKFLETIKETASCRGSIFPKGHLLWRAQNGCGFAIHEPVNKEGLKPFTFEIPEPYSASRMIPSAQYVGDGRANPCRIPYLYLASDQETAMSESRPWRGCIMTVAEFHLKRDCKMLDCSLDGFELSKASDNTPEEREKCVWMAIADAFSKPVAPGEGLLEYIPTQVLAEYFKTLGLDGVVYNSYMRRGGLNIVLFDPDVAEIGRRFMCRTTSVEFGFDEYAPKPPTLASR